MYKKIVNRTKPLVSPLKAKLCSTFLCRLKGLMFSSPIDVNDSLLLSMPKESILNAGIHMVSVNYDIGAVWINNDLLVVDIQFAKRWVSVLTPKNPAKYVLEIHPTRMAEFQLGDIIQFDEF